MRRFINTRQLLFLLIIITMLVIAQRRQKRKSESREKSIKSSLLDPQRSMPAAYSPLFSCLMKCRQMDAEDVKNIMKYGQLRIHKDSLFFTGRNSDGRLLEISGILRADHILFLSMNATPDDCPCPETAKAEDKAGEK